MVIIDFSATWCGPCWNYHNTHILADIYDDYGPNGSDEVMVFFIEGDPSTPQSALYGGPGSQGNWVAGTPYPIMDDPSGGVTSSYSITYFPTLYAICPNGKTYVAGQVSYSGWENWIQTCSLDESHIAFDSDCYDSANGSIDLTPSGGYGNTYFQWSNGSNTQDISNLAPGTYYCTLTEGQGHTIETGPIVVSSPPELEILAASIIDVECFGEAEGSISVTAGGGSPGYSYQWSNGQSGPQLSNVPAGNYTLVITDANGCTKTESYTIQQPLPLSSTATVQDENCESEDGFILLNPQGGTYPYYFDIGNGPSQTPVFSELAAGTYAISVTDAYACQFVMNVDVENIPGPTADAGPMAQLDCLNPDVLLDGSNSESGSTITYQWTTTDGDIISGDDTTTPLVGAAGTYELTVTEEVSGCTSVSTVQVAEDFVQPVSDAGSDGELDCSATQLQLDGSNSSQGSQIEYLWTTPDGNILEGDDTTQPLVDAPGTYQLEVINTQNGCSSISSVEILADLDTPLADAGPSGQLDCTTSLLLLDGSGSDAGDNIFYLWTTADGNIVSGDDTTSPEVDAAGTYQLEVLDVDNGCVSTAEVVVVEDVAIPIADAGADATLNCNLTSVQLDGSASDAGSSIEYEWTTPDGNIVTGEDSTEPTIDAPGTYILEVFDTNNGCSSTAEVAVGETPPVQISLDSQVNPECPMENTGEATVSAFDGTGPYNFAWSSGGTEATESNLVAGVYTVSVTDADNCTASMEVEIVEPEPVLANASATNETSAGANDGTAMVEPSGGTGPYTYNWSTGDMTASIDGLAPGRILRKYY